MASASAHVAARRVRDIRAERLLGARSVFEGVVPGVEMVVLTHGQFSLVDALGALVDRTGPCRVTISTWTAARADVVEARRLLDDGRVLSMRWLVDRSFLTRQPDYCRALRERFGDECIRTTRMHAKFVVLRNDRWDLAVRTSMNLNPNPRLELIEVSDDRALADFLDGEVDGFFGGQAPGVFDGELPAARAGVPRRVVAARHRRERRVDARPVA